MITATFPSATANSEYSQSITLNKPFELTGFSAPSGMMVKRVGLSIILSGTPATAGSFDIVIGVKDCCCKNHDSITSTLTVT